MLRLSAGTLAACGERLPVPTYDRDRVRVGVVHFGVGAFHRAHQAMFHDLLMNRGVGLEWGICGVGVMPADRRVRDALTAQDGLYTLVLKHSDGSHEARVVGSIVEYLFAPDDPEAVVRRLTDPAVRIVSMTVTEGGYAIDHVTGQFRADSPEVVQDLARRDGFRTVFGLTTEALRRRRAAGTAPFTVMSCDNLPGNGHLARHAFTAFANLLDPDLGGWIEREVSFVNSMVDRITPVTTDADRAQVRQRHGIADEWPVVAEPFAQWVLQDDFPTGRPPYEQVGVQLVTDVEPYELMKLRLLNAGHQAIAYFGHLAGHRLVHEAAADPLVRAFLRDYLDHEATPTLAPVPGVDLAAYKLTLLDRFANPEVRDTIARLCADTSERIPKWVLPVIRERSSRGGELHRAAAVVASWARYAEGTDEQGRPIEVVDPLRDTLVAAAARQRDDPLAFVADRAVFGDLVDDERFVRAYRWALESLHQVGARATLAALVAP